MNPYIYLRALKHAEHTVFCVQDGQKTYFDPQFNRVVAYSSGQQVKRSILDSITSNLNVQMAPITFNYNVTAKKELENKEPWSPCDPTYIDQLLGGWMRAGDGITVKRRSPLSISAMRPLHPLLAGVDKENLTFDRSDKPDRHPVNVRMGDKLLTDEEIDEFCQQINAHCHEETGFLTMQEPEVYLFMILPLIYVPFFRYRPTNMNRNWTKKNRRI